ncbi:hypothetical protein [Pseudonocardia lacus]|nr:hypothetical protein [Pseudonocardia lacus]
MGTAIRVVLFTATVVALVILLLASGGDPAAADAIGSAAFLG